MIDYTVLQGDCLETLRGMTDSSVDAVVTDPPYGLSKEPDMAEVLRHWLAGDDYTHTGSGFMGKSWDSFVPGPSVWREVLRVLKPGGHALVFAGGRTQDLMTVALRLGGFQIRDTAMWLYGSGFPKSLDVSKAIDKDAGHWRGRAGSVTTENGAMSGGNYERTPKGEPITAAAAAWYGWGTALKPGYEPVIIARKPLDGTIADTVLKQGTGAINIDGCRVPSDEVTGWGGKGAGGDTWNETNNGLGKDGEARPVLGRWPANVLHDGCLSDQPWGRYFYCAKASKADRNEGLGHLGARSAGEVTGRKEGSAGAANPRAGMTSDKYRNHHPTVKPTELMRWCVRLVTPPGGTVLDPFAGSGSTGKAALLEGFSALLCERETECIPIIEARCADALWRRITS